MNAVVRLASNPEVRLWSGRAQRYWPAAAAAVAALMLAIAHAFEAAGYEPCALCLRQREVYWGALAIAAAAAPFWARAPEGRMARAANALLGAAFLSGALVAAYHAGVEWKFWPGPPSCTAGATNIGGEDILAALSAGGPAVSCDDAAWRDPILRLSMAGWNMLFSLALGAASFAAACRREDEVVSAHHD